MLVGPITVEVMHHGGVRYPKSSHYHNCCVLIYAIHNFGEMSVPRSPLATLKPRHTEATSNWAMLSARTSRTRDDSCHDRTVFRSVGSPYLRTPVIDVLDISDS